MEHFKMSTARDFRIQAEVLNDVLQQEQPDEEAESADESDVTAEWLTEHLQVTFIS